MKKILVIGESCLDVFVYCKAERLAPDVPIPVLSIINQIENPGMAKNTERNIKAIHTSCDIVTNSNWKDVIKTRYVHLGSNHAFVRVDTDHRMKRVNAKKIPFKKYDLIAISDYNKGFLTESVISCICKNHPIVFVDTKKPVGSWLKDAQYIKINDHEYRNSLPIAVSIEDKIIRTHGEYGAEFKGKNYPVKKIETKDVSGAGDSFFAALVVCFCRRPQESDRRTTVCIFFGLEGWAKRGA